MPSSMNPKKKATAKREELQRVRTVAIMQSEFLSKSGISPSTVI